MAKFIAIIIATPAAAAVGTFFGFCVAYGIGLDGMAVDVMGGIFAGMFMASAIEAVMEPAEKVAI